MSALEDNIGLETSRRWFPFDFILSDRPVQAIGKVAGGNHFMYGAILQFHPAQPFRAALADFEVWQQRYETAVAVFPEIQLRDQAHGPSQRPNGFDLRLESFWAFTSFKKTKFRFCYLCLEVLLDLAYLFPDNRDTLRQFRQLRDAKIEKLSF
jgi:hypothetical protein